MIVQNLHTHTIFGDGRNTAEEMVRGAISFGCTSLGFSEHSPLPPAADPVGWSMAESDVPAYRAEVLGLREQWAGQLNIFLGLEQDIDSQPPAEHYDYLIGSVHGVWREGRYLSVDESRESFLRSVREDFGGDSLSFAEAYYQRAASVVERTGCQIVGHFDLVTKFNQGDQLFPTDDPRYIAAAMGALEALLQTDAVFEINTGAMSRGYRTAPYPALPLLRTIRERGGRVCLTSDSHNAQTILYAFDQAAELARMCGFQEVWTLTEQGFIPQGL